MILVDSSVWISHLRHSDPALVELLEAGDVVTHPLVVGELACGSISNREAVLSLLQELPHLPEASHTEALVFIERHDLMGRGIGYIDVNLLASTLLSNETALWTADARLAWAASRLFVSFSP